MLSESTKWRLTLGLCAAGLLVGLLMIFFEWHHGPKGGGRFENMFGGTTGSIAWAEQAVIFLFGVAHLIVAALITVYRRTAT